MQPVRGKDHVSVKGYHPGAFNEFEALAAGFTYSGSPLPEGDVSVFLKPFIGTVGAASIDGDDVYIWYGEADRFKAGG
jgi:hypothetical protein